MIRKWFLLPILLFAIALSAYGQTKNNSVDETEMMPHQLLDIQENISLVRLIANPEKYDG